MLPTSEIHCVGKTSSLISHRDHYILAMFRQMPSASKGRPPALSEKRAEELRETLHKAVNNKRAMTREEVAALMEEQRRDFEEKEERTGNPWGRGKPIVVPKSAVSKMMKTIGLGSVSINPTPIYRFIAEHDWRNAFSYLWALTAILNPGQPNSVMPAFIFNLDSSSVPCNEATTKVLAPLKPRTRSGEKSISRPAAKRGQKFYSQLYALLAADGDIGPVLTTLKDTSVDEIVDIPISGLGREPTTTGHVWAVPKSDDKLF